MTLFILIRQHNAIKGLLEEYNKYDTPIRKAFNLPPKKPPLYENLSIPYANLDFMLTESNPDFLLRLSIEEERFFQTIETIKIRNEFYVNEVQVEMGKVVKNGAIISIEWLEEAVGQRIVQGALQSSAAAFEFIEKTDASIFSIISEFQCVARELYPDVNFLGSEERERA